MLKMRLNDMTAWYNRRTKLNSRILAAILLCCQGVAIVPKNNKYLETTHFLRNADKLFVPPQEPLEIPIRSYQHQDSQSQIMDWTSALA